MGGKVCYLCGGDGSRLSIHDNQRYVVTMCGRCFALFQDWGESEEYWRKRIDHKNLSAYLEASEWQQKVFRYNDIWYENSKFKDVEGRLAEILLVHDPEWPSYHIYIDSAIGMLAIFADQEPVDIMKDICRVEGEG